MCKESVPTVFGVISYCMLISLFALALTNMIISILNPKEFETFLWKKIDRTKDYRSTYSYDLLMDLNFGTHLGYNSDYDMTYYKSRRISFPIDYIFENGAIIGEVLPRKKSSIILLSSNVILFALYKKQTPPFLLINSGFPILFRYTCINSPIVF